MKGIIFNVLEDIVTAQHGADTWDDLLEAAEIDGAYTSLGNYPDEELTKLVQAAAAALHVPPTDVLRWFGRRAIPLLADRFPQFFESRQTTLDFLLTINDIIHPEVKKLYRGAVVPEFVLTPESDRGLTIVYSSPRRLCALAEGFIHGAADHYKQVVEIQQPQCMMQGAAQCVLVCSLGFGE